MLENKRTLQDLQVMQSLPLSVKVRMTEQRIRDWVDEYGEDGVYVSFSGGKDSTVLLHIARKLYPNMKAMFVDVPTQYPELKEFAKTFDNVDIIKPKITFMEVCKKYGFPLISKEVSDRVDGARKYLKILTDRQTDRQTIPYATHMADVMGIDRRINKQNQDYKQLQMGIIPSEVGGVEVKDCRLAMMLGIYEQGWKNKDTFPSVDMSISGWWRYKAVLGELEDKKEGYEKSLFNCSRYKFLLGAKFNVSARCCNVMKKNPAHTYHRQTGRNPITAQTASESRLRTQQWLKNGCNGFNLKIPTSNPMSFWTEQDVLLYIKLNNIPICSVYGDVVIDYDEEGQIDGQMDMSELSADLGIFDTGNRPLKTTGCSRTGCVLCGFGCHLEKEGEGRFELLKQTHPKLYGLLDVIENNGVTYREAIDWINENGNLHIRY